MVRSSLVSLRSIGGLARYTVLAIRTDHRASKLQTPSAPAVCPCALQDMQKTHQISRA